MRRVLLFTLAIPLLAESPAAIYPFQEMIDNWKTSKCFTVEVAEAMPAEFYEFKAAPEEMSFGGLMLHIAFANATRFANIKGIAMPLAQPRNSTRRSCSTC